MEDESLMMIPQARDVTQKRFAFCDLTGHLSNHLSSAFPWLSHRTSVSWGKSPSSDRTPPEQTFPGVWHSDKLSALSRHFPPASFPESFLPVRWFEHTSQVLQMLSVSLRWCQLSLL